ncbi:MAG: hypothetical protein FJX76_09295 [Armatimonadetes bacterium]|nr:hypothetical protein [Armatimonadota bacterium]
MSTDITIPGTFNEWDPAAREWTAHGIGTDRFELRHHLSAGRHAFKWARADGWRDAWGGRGSEPVTVPTGGTLVRDGVDIVLNLTTAGEYRFLIDLARRKWAVLPVQPEVSPATALAPQRALEGPFGNALRRLRAGGEGKPFGYDWHDWDRVRAVLDLGGFGGVFPLREGHEVLFVYNGALDGALYLTGSMNGWARERFERVPGTDVHLLYRHLDPHAAHYYKLHHAGGWFSDPLNAWVAPDGFPVPMFQTGEFNSVLDLGMPACERGDNLLRIRAFPSVIRKNWRDVFISLPRGYAFTDQRYPVLYVNDGNEAITRAFMHRVARETMEAGKARPCILVFVALARQNDRNYEYSHLDGRREYSEFLARELVPFVDHHFRTIRTAGARAVAGQSYGGAIAYFVAWRYPEIFGKVAGQGASFFVNDWDLLRLYQETPRHGLFLYLDSARAAAPGQFRDNELSAKYAERVFKEAGYRVRHVRRENQRHDWPSWQERFPEILKTFWPPSA